MSEITSEYYVNIPFDEIIRDFSVFACKWSIKVQMVLCKNIHEYFKNKVIVQMVKVFVHAEADHKRVERLLFEKAVKNDDSNCEIPEIPDTTCDAYSQVLTEILVAPILNSLDKEESKE